MLFYKKATLQETLTNPELFPSTKLEMLAPLIKANDPEIYALRGELVYQLLQSQALDDFRSRMSVLRVKAGIALDNSFLTLIALVQFPEGLALEQFCNHQILVNNNLVFLSRQTGIPFKCFQYVDSLDLFALSYPWFYQLAEEETV
jgi:hypothetical protein